MNLFTDLKSIYNKSKVTTKFDQGSIIVLLKYLSLDKKLIKIIKKLSQFLFFIEPQHMFYLMYLSVHRINYAPFLKYPKKIKKEEDLLAKKIADYLQWSDRELLLNKVFLKEHFLDKRKEWTKKLDL